MAPTPLTCREGCGALVLRGRTEALSWQLLNLDPDPAGNVAVRIDQNDNVFARTLRKGEQPAAFETVHMPHKATCQIEVKRREQRARQPAGSVTQLDAYRAARSAQAAAKRRQYLRPRRKKPITGVRRKPGRTT
jgi:hypothetical protein